MIFYVFLIVKKNEAKPTCLFFLTANESQKCCFVGNNKKTNKKKENLPLWSPLLCTRCRGSGRRGACRWCRARCGRRIPACWRVVAWNCGNRLWPLGSPGRSPPRDVCPWSRTWKRKPQTDRKERPKTFFTHFKCKVLWFGLMNFLECLHSE